MTGAELAFFITGALLIVASLLVVFQTNVVHSAIALIAALFFVAILFVMLQAPMIAVLQVLVYAGAIMVLFLFVIMFLNPGTVEPRRMAVWGWGSAAALLLALILIPLLSGQDTKRESAAPSALFGSPEQLAESLFRDFVLPFEIASVLLLVAIVGAVVLAKRERQR